MRTMNEMHMMIDIVRDFKPLTEAQINELPDKLKAHAMSGKPEACKDSKAGTVVRIIRRNLGHNKGNRGRNYFFTIFPVNIFCSWIKRYEYTPGLK